MRHGIRKLHPRMEVDNIISYHDVVTAEKASLQKGMNFGVGKNYSVFLMSLRENAPYADALDPLTGMLTYEGHDEPQRRGGPKPKEVDQPLTTPRGSWTENGKFFRAAMDFKSGLREKPELIKVYEKISRGIWSYKGFFELIYANIVSDGKRKVFKFSLKPVEKKSFGRVVELPHNRLIPTPVKVEVWRRDRGQCVQCGSTKNIHFDHDIPFSKGGSSMTAANVRLLCAKHNLEKSDKILTIAPWIFAGAATVRTFKSCPAESLTSRCRFLQCKRLFGDVHSSNISSSLGRRLDITFIHSRSCFAAAA
jgi:hypothetical protein